MSEEKRTKITIEGDGTPRGTVLKTESGEIIEGVFSVRFGHKAWDQPWLELTLVPGKVDLKCETLRTSATVNIDHVTEAFETVDVTDRNKLVEWQRPKTEEKV